MTALFTCALMILTPSAYAMCDLQPLEGLVEHTDYRGDVCTLSKRLLQDWRAQRTLIDKINLLAQDFLVAPFERRTDVYMEINYYTLKLRGHLYQRLHGRLGENGNLRLKLINDPQTSPGSELVGYALHFTREWREGRWPLNEHVGTVEMNLTVRDSETLGQTQLCVGEECRVYDSDGNALIARATNAR